MTRKLQNLIHDPVHVRNFHHLRSWSDGDHLYHVRLVAHERKPCDAKLLSNFLQIAVASASAENRSIDFRSLRMSANSAASCHRLPSIQSTSLSDGGRRGAISLPPAGPRKTDAWTRREKSQASKLLHGLTARRFRCQRIARTCSGSRCRPRRWDSPPHVWQFTVRCGLETPSRHESQSRSRS